MDGHLDIVLERRAEAIGAGAGDGRGTVQDGSPRVFYTFFALICLAG